MFETERHQPILVCASASPFSMLHVLDVEGHVDEAHALLERRFVLGIGHEEREDRRCDAVDAAMRRRDRPCPARPRYVRPTPCGRSRCWMSSSRVQTTFTGAPPIAFEHKAASTAKSGFDLRPKPPPKSVTLTVTFSGGSARYCGDHVMRGLRALHAGPNFGLAVDDPARRGRRLHRRMRVVRNVILGLDLLVGACVSRGEVAVAAHDLARLFGRRLHLRAIGLGVIGRVRPVVPGDLQRLAALDRRPGVVSDHRDAARRLEFRGGRRARDLDDLDDAWDLLRVRSRRSDATLPPIHRRTRDDGVFHAGQPDVLAVYGAARRDVEAVDDIGPFLADIAELRRVLERQADGRGGACLGHADIRGNAHRAGVGRELAIAELLPRGFLDDLVVLRLHFGTSERPSASPRPLQHHAGRGADLAHRHEEMAGRTRAVGVLVAVFDLVARALERP